MRAVPLAKVIWGYSIPSETHSSLYEAAMATVALAAFSMSILNLIFISVWAKGLEIEYNQGMKKSSIYGKQYLDYLWEPRGLSENI